MVKIQFIDPMGDFEENPTQERLKSIILNEENDYWDIGSGDTSLDFDDGEIPKSHIHLKGLEEYGFMLDHKYRGDSQRIYSLCNGEHTGETVEAVIGGNPNLYYREHFVPKEMAWEAIEYFLKTGDRKPDLTWEIAEMPDQEF